MNKEIKLNNRVMIALAVVIFAIIGFLIIKSGIGADDLKLQSEKIATPETDKLSINLCNTDKENSDYWTTNKINLVDLDSSGIINQSIALIDPCSNLLVEIIDQRKINGINYLKIKYGNISGWQTERLLKSIND